MEKELGIIWIDEKDKSLTDKIIGKIINFADSEFKRILILTPKLNSDLLKKRVIKELAKVNHRNKFHIVDWEKEIINSEHYKESLQEILEIQEENSEFRLDMHESIKKEIQENSNDIKDLEKEIIQENVLLIEKLALIFASRHQYSVDKVAYISNKTWELYEDIICEKYDNRNRRDFRFVLARI